MADNVDLNPASGGATISTDELAGSVHVQRVKVQFGTDGNAADVNAGNPLPVTGTIAATLSEPISVDDNGGSLTVDVGTALPAGTNNIGDVDVLSVPAPLSTAGGGTEAAALRVTVASDSTGVLSVDDNGASLTVDDGGGSLTVDNPALAVTGGGTEATALRVTVASDSTGVLSVDDNGSTLSVDDGAGSLTVDNPVLSVVGSGTQAAAQRVTLATDSPGIVVEDAVAAADPTGRQMMVRVRTSPTVEVSTSGDHAALTGPVEGGVWTALIGDGIPAERIGGTAANGLDVDVTRLPGAAIDAAVTGNPLYMGGRASTATPTAVNADGDAQALWLDRNGRAHVVIDAVNVSPTIQGNAAHDSDGLAAGNPLMGGGIASAAAPTDVSADNDAVRSWHLRNGAQVIQLSAAGALIPGDASNGLDVDVTRVSGNVSVQGAAAHDAAVAGNPLLTGFEARTSNPTAVSSGDAVRAQADTVGRQVALIGSIPELRGYGKVTLTNTTAADVLAAPGAGVRWVVTNIVITNADTTVSTKVELRDGTTVVMQPDAEKLGGGLTLGNPGGIFYGTANTAITARAVTDSADVDVFLSGYKEPA